MTSKLFGHATSISALSLVEHSLGPLKNSFLKGGGLQRIPHSLVRRALGYLHERDLVVSLRCICKELQKFDFLELQKEQGRADPHKLGRWLASMNEKRLQWAPDEKFLQLARNSLYQSRSLFQEVSLQDSGDREFLIPQPTPNIPGRFNGVKKIFLLGPSAKNFDLGVLFSCCVNLNSLFTSEMHEESFRHLENARSLAELTISRIILSPNSRMAEWINCCPSLEILTLDAAGSDLMAIAQIAKPRLAIKIVDDMLSDTFLEQLDAHMSLTSFSMAEDNDVSNEGIGQLRLPKLESLQIDGCANVETVGIKMFCSSMHFLQRISISRRKDVDCILHGISSCVNLSEIILSRCPQFSVEGLKSFKHFKKLKFLRLSLITNNQIADDSLSEHLVGCENLETLTLTLGAGVTIQGCIRLVRLLPKIKRVASFSFKPDEISSGQKAVPIVQWLIGTEEEGGS